MTFTNAKSTVATKTIIFETSGRADEIAKALISLGEIDADFSGENGDEYLWTDARRGKFETNADYVANTVVNSKAVLKQTAKKGITAYTDAFVKKWLAHEWYYPSLEIDVVKLNGLAEDANIAGIYAFTIIAIDDN